jgi:hypothetical protein
MPVERVTHEDRTLAIILRAGDGEPGVRFATEPDSPLQLGEIERPAGHVIPPHAHNLGRRIVTETHEVLHVHSGTLQVDLYGDSAAPVATRRLSPGDTILLMYGGHGFTFVTACRLLEVKQGPYLAADDKTYL